MDFLQFLNLQNIDLFILGITNAAILILGLVVFLSNRKSITSQTFLLFSIFTIAWSTLNFFITQFSDPSLVLWILRFSTFFAVWHAFSFFQLFYVFPKENIIVGKLYKFFLIPALIFTSYGTLLTPYVFFQVAEFSPEGQVSRVINGPGIALFGLMVIGLILSGLFLLVRKFIKATQNERFPFVLILTGSLATFLLLLTFNFILPAFFDNARFVIFGAIYMLPFIIATAYAIIRHHLLNIKIIATEILTFVLAIVTLFEILLSREIGILVFRVSTFLLVLSFGILLIRSVRKEVEQREQLEVLTNDLERANEELKRLDKAKSEFISIASHQLRTPLTAVKGYISLVLEGSYGKLPEEMQKPIANVYESNERLIKLVNDLLSLSRIESGKMEMQWENVNLQGIIDSVVEELQVKAKEKNIKLVISKSKTPLREIRVDQEKIRNVVLNLIDNAIRYTKEGSIMIQAGQAPDKTLITVSDTGIGMTKEDLGKIFESFVRGKEGVHHWTEGAGLGLYIAKQFTQMHGGKIWAESEGEGKGSRFSVELPIGGE